MNARVAAIEAVTGRSRMHFAHGMYAVLFLAAALAAGFARGSGAGSGAILGAAALAMLALAAVSWDPAPVPGPPAVRGRGRGMPSRPVLLLGLIVFVAFLAENALQSWSALRLERGLEARPATGALAPATLGFAVAVGRFAGQALSARVGEAPLLLGAALLGAAGAAGFALAPSVAAALVCLFLAGSGIAVVAPSVLGIAGRRAAPGERGAAVAMVSVIASTGFFVGPAMMGGIAAAFGLQTALLSLALLLAAVPGLWWLVRHGAV